MKRIVVVIALVLTGCSHQYRTGTICVDRVVTTGFRTNDPVEVKQDVVDAIASQLVPEMKEAIPSHTKMTLADCHQSDHRLSISMAHVDPVASTSLKRGFIRTWTETQRSFQVGLSGTLKDRLGKELVGFDIEDKKDSLSETLNRLAELVSDNIKYVPGK